MIDVGGWAATATGLAAALAAGISVDRMVRLYLSQRTVLQLERQRSKRQALRTDSVVRLAADRRMAVRIVESDDDGSRMIEVEDRTSRERKAA